MMVLLASCCSKLAGFDFIEAARLGLKKGQIVQVMVEDNGK